MADCFIKTENVSFYYESETDARAIPAVDNVSLEIKKGEYVAVLGHNGSGKSTFAKLLNFILEPSSGKIIVDGVDITSEDITDDDVYDLVVGILKDHSDLTAQLVDIVICYIL